MPFIKCQFLAIICLLTFFSHNALALSQCEDVFPGVTTEYGTELTLSTFIESTGVDGSRSGDNLSLEEGHYSDITVATNGSLTFTDTNGDYHVNSISIGQDATINLVAGDYYFSELTMLEDSQLTILGSGTVRIYVENNVTLETEVLINDDEDSLLLIVYGNLTASTGIRFSGLLYVVNDINVDDSIDIHGAITALNIELENPEILDYVDDFLSEIDFDGTCTNTLINFRDALLGYYPFEQSDFTTNILDESGNANNGINIGGVVTNAGRYCRGFDANGSNTTSVTNNAFSTNIDLDDDVGQTGTISFWYQANNDWGDRDRTLFNATRINGNNTDFENKYFYLQTEGGLLNFEFENNDDDDFSINEVIPDDIGDAGVWHYISVTWDILDDVFQIYIDGNLLIERSEDEDGSSFDTDRNFGELGDIFFGDNATDYINGGRFTSADANYDEVRIYSQVLSQSEIEADMNDNNCIDHYQIHHEISGLTCAAETITIKACSNSFNSSEISCTEINESVSLTVNANNNVISSLSFTSSAIVSFNNTVDEIVTLSISNETSTALNGVNCVETNTNNESDCNIDFQNTGFMFETDSSSGTLSGIDNQLSGKPSNIGFNAADISVAIVETNSNTGDCDAILVDETIDIAAQCTDDSSCSEDLMINAVSIDTVSSGSGVNYSALDLGFSNSGIANFVVNYPDAGTLTLFARYNIPLIDGTPSGSFIEGSTNFTVRPFGFDVTVSDTSISPSVNNPAAEDANGDAFIGAGNSFNVALIAKQWQASDDNNNDGVPDVDADLSDNNTTTNFKDDVIITHELISPLLGNNPSLLENTFAAPSFVNGEQSLTTSWEEVGILAFNFNLLDNDYFGAGDVETHIPFIGRFIPDHYQQTVEEHGTLAANGRFWVYSGETDSDGVTGVIRYSTLPLLRITAYSSENTVTENYTVNGEFTTLLASGITFDTIENDNEQLGADTINKVQLTAGLSEGNLEIHNSINGALTYSMSDLDHFVYTKEANSEIASFIANIPLSILSIEDSDGVNQGLDNDGNERLETAIATDIEVRFGRLFIANSYGPETEPLTVPMQLQIYNGIDYQVNSDDSITSISTENNEATLIYAGDDNDFLASDTASVNVVTDTPVEGYVYFIDVTSMNNNRGRVDLAYEVADWLKFDWSNNTVFDENPTASVQFGLFRGNDRIILWREVTP